MAQEERVTALVRLVHGCLFLFSNTLTNCIDPGAPA
jgi:hypothetical protein